MVGDLLRVYQSNLLQVATAPIMVILQVALAIVPVEAMATESVAPIIYYNADYYGTTVGTMDANGCKEGRAKQCAGSLCAPLFNVTLTVGTTGNWGICGDNTLLGYYEFAGLTAACPAASPAFIFNKGTKMCERGTSQELRATADSSVIPTNSRTVGGHVLSKSSLLLTLTEDSKPKSGVLVALQSDRNNLDVFRGPTAATDGAGVAQSEVETRSQPGTSTVIAADPKIKTVRPATIKWLPSRYESEFVVTCYRISRESDYVKTPEVTGVCGLPEKNTYHADFLKDTKMQGSGQALDGTILHYDGGACYSIQACALTKIGTCAQVGRTIAVDKDVIPYRSTVAMDILGSRRAEDKGGRIAGYHIDEYLGPASLNQCIRDFGTKKSGAAFVNY